MVSDSWRGDRSRVSIVRNGGDVEAAVRQAIEMAGGLPSVHGKRVILKPNLVSTKGTGNVTDYRVTEAVGRIALEAGAKVTLAEGKAVGFAGTSEDTDTYQCLETSGHLGVVERLGIDFVDLNKDEFDEIPLAGYYGMATVPVTRTIQQADLVITIPILKVHPSTGVTIATKNLQGTMPWLNKRRTHKVGLEYGLSDINAAIKPGFAVVDAIVARDATGTVDWNLVFAGRDCTAVDSVCCQAMGFDPASVALLRFNQERGLGVWESDRIEVVGLPIEEVRHPFTWPALTVFAQTPEVEYVVDEPNPCSACSGCAHEAVLHIKRAYGAAALRGLRFAVGRSASGLRNVEVDFVVGDCAREWAKGPVTIAGRSPRSGVLAAEIVKYLKLDPNPLIASRRAVANSDWEAIAAILA